MQVPSPTAVSVSAPTSSYPPTQEISPRQEIAASSTVASSHSASRPLQDGYFATPLYTESKMADTGSSEFESSCNRQPQSAVRSLPPLITPQSPQSAVDAKFDPQFSTGPKSTQSSIEPSSRYPSNLPRHPSYTSYGPSNAGSASATREVPETMSNDTSSYSYASPRQQQTHQAQSSSLHHSYNSEPPRSSYSLDPIRASYQIEQQRIALPSMPGLTDPIPPPQQPQLLSHGQTTTSPSHSLERYRFDANPAADHPARRRRGNLPKEATARLNDWFAQHASYPYPKEEEKQRLQEETGLSMSQVRWHHHDQHQHNITPSFQT